MKCSACPCQIDNTKFPLPRAQGKVVCQACFELWNAIHANAFFIAAQTDYILHKIDNLAKDEDEDGD